MEYKIYKKMNNSNVRAFIGYCFIKNPHIEMGMEQVKKNLNILGKSYYLELVYLLQNMYM